MTRPVAHPVHADNSTRSLLLRSGSRGGRMRPPLHKNLELANSMLSVRALCDLSEFQLTLKSGGVDGEEGKTLPGGRP